LEAEKAGCLAWGGDDCPWSWEGWGAACWGSSDGPACIRLHPETAELGCPVLVRDGKPFQKGCVACTPACYCTL